MISLLSMYMRCDVGEIHQLVLRWDVFGVGFWWFITWEPEMCALVRVACTVCELGNATARETHNADGVGRYIRGTYMSSKKPTVTGDN